PSRQLPMEPNTPQTQTSAHRTRPPDLPPAPPATGETGNPADDEIRRLLAALREAVKTVEQSIDSGVPVPETPDICAAVERSAAGLRSLRAALAHLPRDPEP